MKKFEKLITLLIILTILAVVFKKSILEKTILLSPKTTSQYQTYNDSAIGGNSQINLLSTEKSFHWQCNITDKITYPYCALEIVLGDSNTKGVDLTQFTKFKLWLAYQGEADTIRIYLRNYHPDYSNSTDDTSSKYNAIDINIKHLKDGLEIDLRNFNVPSWWQLERKLAPHLMSPEFDNIVKFDVQTGTNVNAGLHEFKLTKAEFIGQWLSNENWYLSIMIFWLIVVLLILLQRQIHLLTTIELKDEREKELLQLNTHLDSEGKKFKDEAQRDKLTGAFNRAGAEIKLAEALAEKQNDGFIFSIIVLDIDHFKKINDRYGHDAGDAVLIQLSATIQNNIRSTDDFARWGGEEFIIICRKTTLTSAAAIAEQLREVISATILIGDILVTASLGVAEIYGNENDSVTDAFKRADLALYRAKNSGRNKVEISQPSVYV